MPAPFAQKTPFLGQFLVAINGFVQVGNEKELADYVALEPPFRPHYKSLISELQTAYPRPATGDALVKGSSGNGVEALEDRCAQSLPAAREAWIPFVKFMAQYLAYIRDITDDPGKYLDTYKLLSELQVRANSALNHPSLGSLMLPIVVRCAKLVCRLAIGLDKHPELIAHLQSNGAGGGDDDGGPRETLPERAANILRQAFVTCLNDRVSGLNNNGEPEGKKRGIYTIANICLKILFQCGKTRNATQIFENIYNLSPPLAAYPKSERVTYLYYLGRFLFQNSHFYRAQLALQHAYDECPTADACVRQRRKILIYLVSSNIIIGRFPSAALLQRPESAGFMECFLPVMQSIRRGDLVAFRAHLTPTSATNTGNRGNQYADWLAQQRVLLPLRNRGEVLLWRSLIRKIWILHGTRPSPDSKAGPLVHISDLVTALTAMEQAIHAGTRGSGGADDPTYVDPDFEGVNFEDTEDENLALPSARTVESILSSLVDQGLLHGFIAHRASKFVISGVRAKGGDILAAGFPNPWEVIRQKADDEVPGWKKQKMGAAMGLASGVGPGMVVNLSNLKPVGIAG